MRSLKWVLALVLTAAFTVHVVWLDLPVLLDLENPVLFVDGMQELSVLGIILSLLNVSLAMKLPEKAAPAPAEPEAPEQEPAPFAPAEEPAALAPELPVILAEPAPAYPVEELPLPDEQADVPEVEKP